MEADEALAEEAMEKARKRYSVKARKREELRVRLADARALYQDREAKQKAQRMAALKTERAKLQRQESTDE